MPTVQSVFYQVFGINFQKSPRIEEKRKINFPFLNCGTVLLVHPCLAHNGVRTCFSKKKKNLLNTP